jgi:hypothetical protein
MNKANLPMDKLKRVCMMAFCSANLPISDIELVMVEERGERANWDLRALSPEPSYETAVRAYEILSDLQDAFGLAGKPAVIISALG